MVQLQKLSFDKFYKELGFKNKSKGIAFIRGILQTQSNKFKTADDLKNHLKPKLQNLKTLNIDINDKFNSKVFKDLKYLRKHLKKINSKEHKKILNKNKLTQ